MKKCTHTTNKNAKREKECERLIKKFERAEKTIKVRMKNKKVRIDEKNYLISMHYKI